MNFLSLAQESTPQVTDLLSRILRPEVLVFMIPISAIMVGGMITVTKMIIRHRERITMIQNGYDPDASRRAEAGVQVS